jgi:hypothetical protein
MSVRENVFKKVEPNLIVLVGEFKGKRETIESSSIGHKKVQMSTASPDDPWPVEQQLLWPQIYAGHRMIPLLGR